MTTGLQRIKAFFKSPHHLWLAALTLGIGAASANTFGLIGGTALYAIGWVFLPDSKRFNRWLDKRTNTTAENSEDARRAAALLASRRLTFDNLTPDRQGRYRDLAAVVADIEDHLQKLPARSSVLSTDAQMQPLDSLMASYLRLLHTGQVLDKFITTEESEHLDTTAADLKKEITGLSSRCAANPADSACSQLLDSRRAKLETLGKRLSKLASARDNLELTRAEQERTAELVKLARADLVTSHDPSALSHRIDSGARQVTEQTEWARTWDTSTDLDPTFDLSPGARIGYNLESSPPPVPQ
ncbi:MAG: hypothetical protein P8J87_05570 [Verrucomicrobiales bacterium]|nr:hypothetical protein [Verrucomicrobiales bacterium]